MKIDPTLYTDGQFEELCRGKAAGIDYSLYANPEYNEYQMFELRMALTNGQDISDIAFTHYSHEVMNMLRWCIDNNIYPNLLGEAFKICRNMEMMGYLLFVMTEIRKIYNFNLDSI